MFIVKASYGKETRRFTLAQSSFPSFGQLYSQVQRVLPSGKKYYLTKLLFTSGVGATQQLIAEEIHSEEEYSSKTAHLAAQSFAHAKLRFDVKEGSAPKPQSFANARSNKSTRSSVSPSCANGPVKQEVKDLMDKFLKDFGQIMSSTFGEVSENTATSSPTLTARPPVDVQATSPIFNDVVHRNIVCDVCDKTVVGSRYKCTDCRDYDLCQECIQTVSVTHPFHQFREIRSPGDGVAITIEGNGNVHNSVHNASCDLCDSRIRGIRYKCTNCPDFDVCENCFKIVPQQHPTHVFVKLSNPKDIMPGLPQDHRTAHSARCNACGKMIYGLRYKCLMCPDFDLCMHCEALPIPVHPDTHVMCKVKSDTVTASHPLFQILASVQPNCIGDPENKESTPVENLPLGSPGNGKGLPAIPSTSFVKEETEITSFRGAPAHYSLLKATFLTDNNMPDGQIIAPGAEFVKSWRMTNDGNTSWPEGTALVFIAGNRLAAFKDAPTRYKVGDVAPGSAVDVWAGDMKAPDEPGRYVSYWSLQDEEGYSFGHRVWCDIVVPELESDLSSHVGSITLPPLETTRDVLVHTENGVHSLPQAVSEITEPITTSTQSGSQSASLDSKSLGEWEETTDLLPESDHGIQAREGASGRVPTEWVILDDD